MLIIFASLCLSAQLLISPIGPITPIGHIHNLTINIELMPKNRRVIYADGYEHLSHRRDIAVTFYLNESEKAAMDDMLAALEVKNQSEFIRNQIFGAYKSMTLEQLRKMAEVAAFRAEDARLHELSP